MPKLTIATEVFHIQPTGLDQVLELLNDLDEPDSDGTIRITVPRTRIQASAPHATEIDVANQIAIDGGINDEAALAIASWYQSPRGVGQTFNLFASGRPVAVDELLDAIDAELGLIQPPQSGRSSELKALARWVELAVEEN